MLKLADFFHLPHVATLFDHVTAQGPGLVIVAGLSPAPGSPPQSHLASGHTTVFRMLMREVLARHTEATCTVITQDRAIIRVPREFRSRVTTHVPGIHDYAELITRARVQAPHLIVIDQLNADSTVAALDAARQGRWVIALLDTALSGADAMHQLRDMGAETDHLAGLTWIIAVQRMATLCPQCKTPLALTDDQHTWITGRLAAAGRPNAESLRLFNTVGCDRCRHTGRAGDVMVFDFYHAQAGARDQQPGSVAADEYALLLALEGYLSFDDARDFQAAHLRRLNQMLTANRQLVDRTTRSMERKVAELEAANRVLEDRTRALITLQDFVHTLADSTGLSALTERICHHACTLCRGAHAILYVRRPDGQAEIGSVLGWPDVPTGQQFAPASVFTDAIGDDIATYVGLPPGATYAEDPGLIRHGLSVPLRTQDGLVGLILLHGINPTQLTPGNRAMLQALADQAALAIQLNNLIEARAHQERIARELELARQVQQSVLPRHFPEIAGYRFAARNEPARQVGGDFYDVIALDDEHFGIAIADVSGKGIPAALFMTLTRSVLRAKAYHSIDSPCEMLMGLNTLLQELGQPDMFVTVFYGVLDRPSRRLTYARAGHDRPVLLRGDHAQELQGKGTALGLFDRAGLKLSEEQVDLRPGDRLVLYTDGLTDITNPAGDFFERGPLITLLQSQATRAPDDICAAVFRHLITYQDRAPQYDDMTMLVMAVD